MEAMAMTPSGGRMEARSLLPSSLKHWASTEAWSGSSNSSFSCEIMLNQVKNRCKNIYEFICHLTLSIFASSSPMNFSVLFFSILGPLALS
jgi:hypothetical protein